MLRDVLYYGFFLALSAGLHWAAIATPWSAAGTDSDPVAVARDITRLESEVRTLRAEVAAREAQETGLEKSRGPARNPGSRSGVAR